jgi:hypothetical protein
MKGNRFQKAGPFFCSPLLIATLLIGGCTTASTGGRLDPEYGRRVEAGLAAQAINPNAPDDPTPADSLPGDLANQIYKKRYIKAMTEEKKEKDDTASQLSGLD